MAVGDLNDILQRLEPSLGPLSGEPQPLEGGITNRNFRVMLGGEDYVVRLPGRDTALLGIVRDAEHMASETAAQLGIAPAVAAAVDGCLVTRFIPCWPVTFAELAAAVEDIAASLRRFHDSEVPLPAHFWVPDLLAAYEATVRSRGGSPPSWYADLGHVCAQIAAALVAGEHRPCHNDLLRGNIIRCCDDGRMMIVDWDYAGMGDPRFDLGNLSVNNEFGEEDDERLLAAYYGEPATDQRRAALKLMRIMSDAREAAWGVVQAEISDLDFDFQQYARTHRDRLLAASRDPLFGDWLAAAR